MFLLQWIQPHAKFGTVAAQHPSSDPRSEIKPEPWQVQKRWSRISQEQPRASSGQIRSFWLEQGLREG